MADESKRTSHYQWEREWLAVDGGGGRERVGWYENQFVIRLFFVREEDNRRWVAIVAHKLVAFFRDDHKNSSFLEYTNIKIQKYHQLFWQKLFC